MLLFDAWFAEARAGEPNDAEAMALATADADGRPSVRMVLLKGHDARGFAFYTNSGSRKGGELAANPARRLAVPLEVAAPPGPRSKAGSSRSTTAEADAYFATRSRDARIGAWASDQSRPLDSRAAFEARYETLVARVRGQGRAAAALLARLSPRPRADRILDRPAAPPARAPAVHRAAGDGWSEGLLYP